MHRIRPLALRPTVSSAVLRDMATSTTHKHTHQSIIPQIHPRLMYQIINNVDEYRHFLPYCHESKILQVSPCGTMMDAVLSVGLPMGSTSSVGIFEEKYVSRVRMIPPKNLDEDALQIWVVEAKSIQSKTFDSLKSRWILKPVRDEDETTHACDVNFHVEIEVSNPLISFTLDKVLKDVARKQVDAFERRCRSFSVKVSGDH